MQLVPAFLKLIRLPNLLFILLCQFLFQYCIYVPLHAGEIPAGDTGHFLFLVAASLSIAAAGYIINDYFDINIDEVNKPSQLVVDRLISRRWAIAWHFILSTLGIVFTIFALRGWKNWYLVPANIACVALLWFYSTSFKRKVLVGNLVISLLTSWTILVIFFSKFSFTDAFGTGGAGQEKFFRLAMLYAGFAFIISLIREAIKDLEDMPGDRRFGCRTMPIAWGVNATKMYTAVWLVVLIAVLVMVQIYVMQFQWWLPVAYSVILVIAPLLLVLLRLRGTGDPQGYHRLSQWTKFVMLTGILSMVFFYFYL